MNRLVGQEVNNGIRSDRIVIGGFSQGAAISLLTGLRSEYRLAGVVSYSGFLGMENKTREVSTRPDRTLSLMSTDGFWSQQENTLLIGSRYPRSVDFVSDGSSSRSQVEITALSGQFGHLSQSDTHRERWRSRVTCAFLEESHSFQINIRSLFFCTASPQRWIGWCSSERAISEVGIQSVLIVSCTRLFGLVSKEMGRMKHDHRCKKKKNQECDMFRSLKSTSTCESSGWAKERMKNGPEFRLDQAWVW